MRDNKLLALILPPTPPKLILFPLLLILRRAPIILLPPGASLRGTSDCCSLLFCFDCNRIFCNFVCCSLLIPANDRKFCIASFLLSLFATATLPLPLLLALLGGPSSLLWLGASLDDDAETLRSHGHCCCCCWTLSLLLGCTTTVLSLRTSLVGGLRLNRLVKLITGLKPGLLVLLSRSFSSF